MKINATAQLEVSISDAQEEEIALNYLSKALDWKVNYFIEDSKVCYTATYFSSHSWNSVKIVREASEKDFFAAGVFKILKQMRTQKNEQNQQNP